MTMAFVAVLSCTPENFDMVMEAVNKECWEGGFITDHGLLSAGFITLRIDLGPILFSFASLKYGGSFIGVNRFGTSASEEDILNKNVVN